MNHLRLIYIFAVACLMGLLNAKNQSNKVSFKYVGDGNYTKLLRDHLIKDESRQLLAIMFTNNKCQTCDVFEEQLKQIHQKLSSEKILLFRCDISVNKIMSDKFQIKRFPLIHFMYQKPNLHDDDIQIYKTTQILTSQIIQTAKYLQKTLNFIHSTKTSLPFIQTLEQIPTKNKIVVNAQKIAEFYRFDEADLIHELMLEDSFNAMPIVPLSGQLFQFYQISNSLQNLRQKAKTQIVVYLILEQRQDVPYITIPIEKKQFDLLFSKNLDISSIFKSFLFYSVQQFTQSLYIFQQQFHSLLNPSLPIYLAVVDTIWRRQQARRQVMMLNRVLNIFGNEILIFWIEAQINPEKKVLLGFNKDTLPPMFGKLVLSKSQPKEPLKNLISNQPLFTQSEIKAKIRTDLGYERLLAEKIDSTIQQLGISNFIETAIKIETSKDSKIQFVYCTSRHVQKDELSELEFIIRRFKRFYRESNMKILTQPCLFNDKQVEDGLYISSMNKSHLVSSKIIPCIDIEPKIQQITKMFAEISHKQKLIPQHVCVVEKQMREFLIHLKE